MDRLEFSVWFFVLFLCVFIDFSRFSLVFIFIFSDTCRLFSIYVVHFCIYAYHFWIHVPHFLITCQPMKMVRDDLMLFDVPRANRSIHDRQCWWSSNVGWVKINVDGVINNAARSAGGGGVARSYLSFLGAWSKPFFGVTSHYHRSYGPPRGRHFDATQWFLSCVDGSGLFRGC